MTDNKEIVVRMERQAMCSHVVLLTLVLFTEE
jgi:hypothetical protein